MYCHAGLKTLTYKDALRINEYHQTVTKFPLPQSYPFVAALTPSMRSPRSSQQSHSKKPVVIPNRKDDAIQVVFHERPQLPQTQPSIRNNSSTLLIHATVHCRIKTTTITHRDRVQEDSRINSS